MNWINYGRETNIEFAFVGYFRCIWKLFVSVSLIKLAYWIQQNPEWKVGVDFIWHFHFHFVSITFGRTLLIFLENRLYIIIIAFFLNQFELCGDWTDQQQSRERTSFNTQILFICHRFCRLFANFCLIKTNFVCPFERCWQRDKCKVIYWRKKSNVIYRSCTTKPMLCVLARDAIRNWRTALW